MFASVPDLTSSLVAQIGDYALVLDSQLSTNADMYIYNANESQFNYWFNSGIVIELNNMQCGLSQYAKNLIVDIFRKCAFSESDANGYVDDLEIEFGGRKNVVSISAAFTQGDFVAYSDTKLDDLRSYLSVTAAYDDGTSGIVTTYTLSGTLNSESSPCTITVLYNGKTATFSVVVSQKVIDILISDYNEFKQGWGSVSTANNYDVNTNYSKGASAPLSNIDPSYVYSGQTVLTNNIPLKSGDKFVLGDYVNYKYQLCGKVIPESSSTDFIVQDGTSDYILQQSDISHCLVAIVARNGSSEPLTSEDIAWINANAKFERII